MTFKKLIMESADVGFAGLSLKEQRAQMLRIFSRACTWGEKDYKFQLPKELKLSNRNTIVGFGSVTISIDYLESPHTISFKMTQPVGFETIIGDTSLRTNMGFEPESFEAIIDDILVKMDKKTLQSVTSQISRSQKGKKKDFNYKPVAEKVYNMSETREFKELEKAYLEKKEAERAQKEAEALKKQQAELKEIAAEYKVDINRVAKGRKEAVIVYDENIKAEDREDITSLIGMFDTQVWAIDRGYREAEERNQDILKRLGEYGSGIVYYTTGPNNTDMKVKV